MSIKDSDTDQQPSGRREALKILGGSALALSAAGLGACSGGGSDSAPSNAMDEAAEAASQAAEELQDAANDAMETVEETVDEAMETVEDAVDDVAETADDVVEEVENVVEEATDAGGLPRLDESDPQAQALGYVNDVANVDASAQPRYAPGQACRNCSLFTADEGAQWGPCSIFPGKAVNANAWCSVYAPKT